MAKRKTKVATKKSGKKNKSSFGDYLPFLIIGAAVIITGVGLYLVIKQEKEDDLAGANTASNQGNTSLFPPSQPPSQSSTPTDRPSSFSCLFGDSFPLQWGSCGENVKTWQRHLNSTQGTSLSVDGKFGDRTESATKNYPPFGNSSQFSLGRVNEMDFNMATFERN